jgi:glycosyltransferase involved in cell wall biosynthesis
MKFDHSPVFGIIIPAYSRPAELRTAIQSVENQTYEDWQVIVIDDSGVGLATDGLNPSDPRIKVHVNEINMGTNRSRNVGLDALLDRVDYITFLDDDDCFVSETLETAASFLMATGVKWGLSRRISAETGESFTQLIDGQTEYDYVYDCMVEKHLSGDATHFIATDIIRETGARFPGELQYLSEWRFWAGVGSATKVHFFEGATTLGANYESDNLSSVSSRSIEFRTREIVDLYEFFGLQSIPDSRSNAVDTMLREKVAIVLPRSIMMRRFDLASNIVSASHFSHLFFNRLLFSRLVRMARVLSCKHLKKILRRTHRSRTG